MAYPPGPPRKGPRVPPEHILRTETLPVNGEEKVQYDWRHNDIYPRNIMFTEHAFGPDHEDVGVMARVIDFGIADDPDERENGEDGAAANLYLCANALIPLITCEDISEDGYFPGGIEDEDEIEYRGWASNAERILSAETYPWLDPDLRDLIARCLYVDEDERPTLQEASRIARKAVREKGPNDFPDPAQETDDRVHDFVQTYFLDSPYDDDNSSHASSY
ncbi:hypothetical protein F5Y16DRAFT_403671 [Xylariaceae sp. FL0255]|nr:hypothetical protein F5Y16DRAFT_403671 [Xylariaceae sp. FL0255]